MPETQSDSEIEQALARGTAARNVRRDVFVERFLQRVPEDLADSFSDRQLMAVKTAFGARARGAHPVDIRLNLNFWLWRGYLVVLAGPERRSADRLAAERSRFPLITLGNTVFALGLGLAALCAAFVILYIVKSALGINLLPNYSLGLWGALKEQWRALTFD